MLLAFYKANYPAQLLRRCDITVLTGSIVNGLIVCTRFWNERNGTIGHLQKDHVTSNYEEKTYNAKDQRWKTQLKKKSRTIGLFENQQNGCREASRTSETTPRKRSAPAYRKQNQNWEKPT